MVWDTDDHAENVFGYPPFRESDPLFCRVIPLGEKTR